MREFSFLYSFSFIVIISMFLPIKNEMINSILYTSCIIALMVFTLMIAIKPKFFYERFGKIVPWIPENIFNIIIFIFHLLPVIYFRYPLNKTLTFCFTTLYYVLFRTTLRDNYPLKDYELFLAALISLLII